MNYFEDLYDDALRSGLDPLVAADTVFEAYLEGKPLQKGRKKYARTEHDQLFWSTASLTRFPRLAWQSQTAVLALTRYMSSPWVGNETFLLHVAALAPASLHTALRHSELVLHADSLHRAELTLLAERLPADFGELQGLFAVFDAEHVYLRKQLEDRKVLLSGLSPLELLIYASLYAFEELVTSAEAVKNSDDHTQDAWDAINDLLVWKLSAGGRDSCVQSESDIARSIKIHLMPFLLPERGEAQPRADLYAAFRQLLRAQLTLNSFINHSVEPLCFDNSIRFVLKGKVAEIIETDPVARVAWRRNGERMARLHEYWFYRAAKQYSDSEQGRTLSGKPENDDANRWAWIKALRTNLQLEEVYGLGTEVKTATGFGLDLFRASLALELMTAYFSIVFIGPYLSHRQDTGDSMAALRLVMQKGLQDPGMLNLLPITWSDHEAKITNIAGWTISDEHPQGSRDIAAAILDFWTSDWNVLADQLAQGDKGPQPELFERPLLKMGHYLFQLPWVVALQNNTTAMINNLRRLGARRMETKAETTRIEARLAMYLENRGVHVVLNHRPAYDNGENPGEVDLICAGGDQVLVIELKSTFLRRSQKEAWLHATMTLRKAASQLRRKVEAVHKELAGDTKLRSSLGYGREAALPTIRGWIVDTSIECDHENFGGFLKLSLEELLIALRDERHYLHDPASVFRTSRTPQAVAESLYETGFSLSRLIDVIENEEVWQALPSLQS